MAKKKKRSDASPADDEPVDFESALRDVESIVHKLENGEADLTESLQHYEMGIKRLKQCHQLLHQAERRVTLLSGFDADGNPVADDFDVQESHPDSSEQKTAKSGGAKPRKRRSKGAIDRSEDKSEVDDTPGLF